VSANGSQFSDSWSQPRSGALGFSRAKALSIVALAAAIETGTFDAEREERDDAPQGGDCRLQAYFSQAALQRQELLVQRRNLRLAVGLRAPVDEYVSPIHAVAA